MSVLLLLSTVPNTCKSSYSLIQGLGNNHSLLGLGNSFPVENSQIEEQN